MMHVVVIKKIKIKIKNKKKINKKNPKQKLIYFYLLMFPKQEGRGKNMGFSISTLKPPLKGQSTDFKVKA